MTSIERLAILYNLSYGGGLIGGDQLSLSLELARDVKLLFLTQVSTLCLVTFLRLIPSSRAPPKSSPRVLAAGWLLDTLEQETHVRDYQQPLIWVHFS